MRRRFSAAALLGALALPVSPGIPAEPATVVIVTPSEERPFGGLIAGLRAGLAEEAPGATVRIVRPEAAANFPDAGAIVGIGSAATRAALAANRPENVVGCMLLGDAPGPRPARTISGEFSPEVELDWLARILPEARRVGILYHDDATRARAARMHQAAAARGREVVTREVVSPRDLPEALDWIASRADVLWGLPDGVVLSTHTAETILLFCLRNRVPFIGASEAWVRGGALFAVERDYEDLGRQCAEATARLLRGERGEERLPPRRSVAAVNVRTSRQLRLTIPADVLAEAKRIVE